MFADSGSALHLGLILTAIGIALVVVSFIGHRRDQLRPARRQQDFPNTRKFIQFAMPEEIVPVLRVTDGYKTAAWYARLGFSVEGEHRFAPGLPLYLFLARGDIHLHLSEHRGDARPDTLLYFYVHDVDRVASEFGVKIVDQPWAREVSLTDPDGNRLRVGVRKDG